MSKLKRQLSYIKYKGFKISDKDFAIKSLNEVGLKKLSRYFINFKNKKNHDFSEVVNHYFFDQEIINLNYGVLNELENTLKSQFFLHIGKNFDNPEFYQEKFKENRIKFIKEKKNILRKKDAELKTLKSEKNFPEVFIDKLTFGEIFKIFCDLKKEKKFGIISYFGIKNIKIFEKWIFGIKYLRNLSCHGENVFNRLMTEEVYGKKIMKILGGKNNNGYLGYFLILCLFNKKFGFVKNYEEKFFEIIKKHSMEIDCFSGEVFHSVLESEAWNTLVNKVYGIYFGSQ